MPRYANKPAITALTSGLIGDGSETTLNVGSTEGWPTPDAGRPAKFAIAPDSSDKTVCSYTGKTATTLTGVVQGIDGTTAFAHNSGTTVEHILSAANIEQFAQKDEANTFTEDQTIEAGNHLLLSTAGALASLSGSNAVLLLHNAKFNGSVWTRTVAQNGATRLYFSGITGDLIYEVATDAGNTVDSTITWGERFRFTKAGDLLIGTDGKHILFGDATSISDVGDQLSLAYNAKFNASGGEWVRMWAENDASMLRLDNNGNLFYYTASDAGATAGSTITFTERFRVSKTGVLTTQNQAFIGGQIDVQGDVFAKDIDTEPMLRLWREYVSTSPASGDIVSRMRGEGEDSAGNTTVYGDIRVVISDPTDGSEDGYMDILVISNGTISRVVRFAHDGASRGFMHFGQDLDGGITVNSGSPEGSVTGGPGMICLNSAGGPPYYKNTGTGNTGWVLMS